LIHQQQLLQALQDRMIPSLQTEGEARLLFANPPVVAPPEVSVLGYYQPPPRPKREQNSPIYQHQWPNEGFEVMRVVEIGCVLEGEADYLLGSDVSRHLHRSDAPDAFHIQIVTMPERTFFVIPPGIVRPNGTRPHWERANPERAFSRIFWILVLPSGAICHICCSRGLTHRNEHYLFIRDRELDPIAQILLQEMRESAPNYTTVARCLLQALLLRIERNLANGQFLLGGQALQPQYTLPNASFTVQRACGYIQERLQEPLTLPAIAKQVYVSPSHLSRMFRAEVGMSVMEYVTQCRIESAKYLLANTEIFCLSIEKISRMVGFSSPSYFTNVFTKQTQLSPTAYREQQRKSVFGS
jgi:AraC-like DNA-binding protein